jgi:hypothetical protein
MTATTGAVGAFLPTVTGSWVEVAEFFSLGCLSDAVLFKVPEFSPAL